MRAAALRVVATIAAASPARALASHVGVICAMAARSPSLSTTGTTGVSVTTSFVSVSGVWQAASVSTKRGK